MTRSLLLSIVAGSLASLCSAAEIPWPEHPRPDFHRSPWVNLNGEWSFAFDPEDVGTKENWYKPGRAFDRKIVVPFPWESKLSGIGDTEYKGVAWYSREITIPDGPEWKGKDAWLIIGACDWEANVCVNGVHAGAHVGGYLPFNVNLSEHGKPGETVTVTIRVKDVADPQQPTGKQVNWYTRTSGIWQTVYLEAWPKARTYGVRVVPDIKAGTARLDLRVTADALNYQVQVSSPEKAFKPVVSAPAAEGKLRGGSATVTVKIDDPKLWSPDSPTLYPAVIRILDGEREVDRLETYFGLREVSRAKASERDYEYIYLNGRPIYLAGALHQSFHPDGIYHYPDDATMRSDYELCKKIGINMLRIHIKTPIPRELYWADKLGVLIMQDMPNPWQHSEQARKWYEEMVFSGTGWSDGAIDRDFNHPSIFAWVNFNETWGLNNPGSYDKDRQEWVRNIHERTKQLDPTRLVEDNSPCYYDHVVTDINSWHFYINDYDKAKQHIQEVVDKTHPGSTFNYIGGNKQGTEPLMNSEYGGISAGSGDQDISWCFKYLTNELRKHDKICGYIYTELSDIEWEHNGFVNYNRTPKEYGYEFWYPEFTLKDINNPDFVVIDAPPCIVLKPGEKREIPIRISHWSGQELDAPTLRWRTRWTNEFGAPREGRWQQQAARFAPYRVVEGPKVVVEAEPGDALGALLVEMVIGQNVLARNYINISVDRRLPRLQAPTARSLVLRFEPSDFAEYAWKDAQMPPLRGIASEKAYGLGAGRITYRLRVPEKVAVSDVSGLDLLLECASKAGDEKLDWPSRKRPGAYPQTDVKKWPSDVRITLNGVEVQRTTLKDDPADARGVLSHLNQYHPGSYGQLLHVRVEGDTLKTAMGAARGNTLTLQFEVPKDAANRGGLAIFGDRLGAYPLDPTVLMMFTKAHGLPAGHTSDEPVAVERIAESQQVIIPTAEQSGHLWKFTLAKPADAWFQPDFDDSAWKTARAGFGTPDTPGAIVGARWRTPDVWLRTQVEVPDPQRLLGGTWRIHHDEDCEVFINGQQVLTLSGFVGEYVEVPADEKTMKALRPGRNLVAVHCRQTGGGQNIDVGLTLMARPAGK